MPLMSIEHSRFAYLADFLLYSLAVALLSAWLVFAHPAGSGPVLALLAGTGLLVWSALEYLLHRFVLHGLPPFKAWHREHHQRPAALICAPTLLSASLIGLLVWFPAVWFLGQWRGSAFTLGVLVGYLAYAFTHHALHHGNARSPWLRRRTHWHARHHHLAQPCCYGVTSGFWDRVMHTAGHRPHRQAPGPRPG